MTRTGSRGRTFRSERKPWWWISDTPREKRFSYDFVKNLDRYERLFVMVPPFEEKTLPKFSPERLQAKHACYSAAVQKRTFGRYLGRMLRIFKFMDETNVDLHLRCPIHPSVVSAFLFTLSRTLAGGTVRGYMSAIVMYHAVHGYDFVMPQAEHRTLGQGAQNTGPPPNELRDAATIDDLEALYKAKATNWENGENTARFAATTITFHCMFRHRDVAVGKVKKLDPQNNLSIDDMEHHDATDSLPEHWLETVPSDKSEHRRGHSSLYGSQTRNTAQ